MDKFNTITSLLLMLAVFAGCGVAPVPSAGDEFRVVPVEAKALEAPVYGETDPAIALAAHGANDFALKLSAALAKTRNDGENFVCSPYSVWLPLAALLNATSEQYRPALLDAIGAAGVTADDVNSAASRMLYDLTKLRDKEFFEEYGGDYHSPLKIANAVFVDNDVTLKNTFAQTFADYFRGAAINVDFASQSAVDAVNKWASDNTEGLITDIIQEFEPETVTAIANAIYFSSRWTWEFNEDETVEDVFHSPNGDTTAHFMLREGNNQTYYEDDRVQAIPLSFKTGGGMYILLPKDGDAKALLSSLTTGYMDEIARDSISATGKLLLPRFKIDSGVMDLQQVLEALGVPLFDRNNAPLTGGLIEENTDVWLSSAVQKAYIEVDEKGTTAAAVTVMAASTSSMPIPTKPFEMICDSPFVFVLYDSTYDGGRQILFTGMVNNP